MRIYHGSDHVIEKPLYGYGKEYNDYGIGFYCTKEISMAKEWGVSSIADGFANIYEFDDSGLKTLNLLSDDYCMLHWLTILLQNREFNITSMLANEAKQYLIENFNLPYNKADVITGYRADDSYFSFAQDFLNGTISYRQLCRAMKLGKLGEQIVLKSKRSFERIKYVGNEPAKIEEWLPRKNIRDSNARKDYFDIKKNKRQKGDLFITKIIDEEMKADDPSLR